MSKLDNSPVPGHTDRGRDTGPMVGPCAPVSGQHRPRIPAIAAASRVMKKDVPLFVVSCRREDNK